ncbi:MAG: ABC transporter substrate-binding protein [Peptostreptococcus sp.]|uniref:ABC transporter substrate-binding protein n=1 Tax=Peptostreptococcus sp. TaxID=1262 RepID=UPI002FC80FC5
MKFTKKEFKKANIKKVLSMAMIATLSIGLLSGCGSKKDETKNIGISQLVEHPALDLSKEGFIEGLKEGGFEEGKNLKIDMQNAQGDVPTAQTIANKFVTDNKDLIFAIATPSVQAAKNATSEIPIIFTAVSDPANAKLVKSNENPGGNITGTSDFQNINKSLDAMNKVLPNAKKIGAIFNTSEINSKIQVENLKKSAKERDMEVIDMGVSSTNEISQAVSVLAKKADVIFTPTDNLMAASMPLIVETAKKDKVAVIGSEEAHVQNGALAANSLSYKEIGREAGKMAAKVLNGEDTSKMPVVFTDKARIVVNEKTMKELGIKLENPEKIEFIK